MLFDNKDRTYDGLPSYGEDEYEYLDRSAREEAQRIREFFNMWTSEYPVAHRDELISRFTSRDQRNLRSAVFELVLFALLRSLEFTVSVHPDLGSGRDKHPDFLAIAPSGERTYVEAVLASEYDATQLSARKRADIVLNAINGINAPDFFLWIDTTGSPETPPRGRALAGDVERWLQTLDVEKVAQEIQAKGIDAAPKRTWEHDRWKIVFKAIPKIPEKRGVSHRPIGTFSEGVRIVNAREPIRDAIKSKGGRYGELTDPFIICANAEVMSVDRIDEMEALFGQEEHIFDVSNPSAPIRTQRRRNGAWFGPKGSEYTRVSGVWIFNSMRPWNIASRRGTLYFNPWATNPLPAIFNSVTHAKPVDQTMHWTEGKTVGQLLQLPDGWPE